MRRAGAAVGGGSPWTARRGVCNCAVGASRGGGGGGKEGGRGVRERRASPQVSAPAPLSRARRHTSQPLEPRRRSPTAPRPAMGARQSAPVAAPGELSLSAAADPAKGDTVHVPRRKVVPTAPLSVGVAGGDRQKRQVRRGEEGGRRAAERQDRALTPPLSLISTRSSPSWPSSSCAWRGPRGAGPGAKAGSQRRRPRGVRGRAPRRRRPRAWMTRERQKFGCVGVSRLIPVASQKEREGRAGGSPRRHPTLLFPRRHPLSLPPRHRTGTGRPRPHPLRPPPPPPA